MKIVVSGFVLALLLVSGGRPVSAQSDDCYGWCDTPYGQVICWLNVIHSDHEKNSRCSNYGFDINSGTVRRGTGSCDILWNNGGTPDNMNDDLFAGMDCVEAVDGVYSYRCGFFGRMRCGNTPDTLSYQCRSWARVPILDVNVSSAHCTSDAPGESFSCSCRGEDFVCIDW